MSDPRTNRALPPPGRRWFLNVLTLYRIRLRHRWLQELLAVAGIAIGVALLFASQVASTSLSGPVHDLNRGLVGNSQLQLVGRGAGGFAERIADQIRALPGVKIAAPVLQVQANVVGTKSSEPITLFGADPRTVELGGANLQGFTADEAAEGEAIGLPAPIARTAGVRFGDDSEIQIAGRAHAVPTAIVTRDDVGSLVDTAIALSPLKYLQRLAGLRDRVSRVLVQAEPGQVDAVRTQIERIAGDRLDVRDADFESRLFDAAAAPTSQATTISSVVSALVGFLFAFCAMLVTVASRRALAIDLRLDGFRPGQIVRVMLFDALALGVVAVVSGLVLGELLSRQGYGSDVSFLGGAFPLGDARIVTWQAVAVAAGGGMAAAVLGVLAPLQGVLRAPSPRAAAPTDPRARPAVPRWVLPAAGGALLAVAVVITAAFPSAALVGLVALVMALALLLPTVLSVVIGLLAAASHHRRHAIVAIELALPQLRAREWRPRALAIALTGAIAVFGAVALQGARANLQAGLDEVSSQLNGVADVWVSPYGTGGLLATAPFSPKLAQGLKSVPGVQAVEPYRASFLDVADRRVWVVAPPAAGAPAVPMSQIIEGRDLGDAPSDGSRWTAVSRALAKSLHLKVGDRFTLPAPLPIELRVAAITTNLGWSGGSIVLTPDDYRRAWQSDAISAGHVQLETGVPPEVGRQAIAQALGEDSALRVETGADRSQRQQASARNGLSRLSQIATLTLVAAILAMASAMAALLWQRRPLVARQKLDGHSTGVMWRTLAVETGALFVTGCLAGAAFALLGQVLFSRGLESISGFPVIATVRGGIAAASFAIVTGVAFLVVLLPGFLVARTQASLRTGD